MEEEKDYFEEPDFKAFCEMDEKESQLKETPVEHLPEENVSDKTNNGSQEGPELGGEDRLMTVLDKLTELNEKFDRKIDRDEHKNRLFDNMHAELTEYRNGTAEKPIVEMALDIIRLNDGLKNSIKRYAAAEPTEENYAKLIKALEGVSEDLEDLLYRQGVEPYSVEGNQADVRRQKLIGSIETDDMSLHNTVADRMVCGYEKDGKVIRTEWIKIFKYISAENK